MEFERAKQLVEAVNSFALYDMGIVDKPGPIGKATLAELCEAARIVREAPDEVLPDGSKRCLTYPDERLIAAVYTATHYEPGTCERPNIIVTYPPVGLHGKSALCLVEVVEGREDDDE